MPFVELDRLDGLWTGELARVVRSTSELPGTNYTLHDVAAAGYANSHELQRRLRRDHQRSGGSAMINPLTHARDAARTVLAEHGYRNAEVSADELDERYRWIVEPGRDDTMRGYLHESETWVAYRVESDGGVTCVAVLDTQGYSIARFDADGRRLAGILIPPHDYALVLVEAAAKASS